MIRALPLLTTLACIPDDWDTDRSDTIDSAEDTEDPQDTSTSVDDPALVGGWRSDGVNRSRFFQRLEIVWVEASFRADGSYTVTSQDQDGQRGEFIGTWQVDTGTQPRGIVLYQERPYEGRAEGLYAVGGSELTLETVQTLPDYGNTPPRGSFGTSKGSGLSPGDNVQTYVRK